KTLLLLFGLPVVQIILFGFALTNEIKNTKIAVSDYSRDQATQGIINKLEAGNYFKIEKNLLSQSQIESAFKEGEIKMAIIFPEKFNRDLLHLHQAQVQIIADASDPNTATTISNYATAVIKDYQREMLLGKEPPFQIGTETRMIYNPTLSGVTNFVPGVMAL